MKNYAFQIKTVLLCVAFFLVLYTVSAQEKSVITVERAQSTETRKNKITDSDVIFFHGDVALSVVKGTNTTRINAEVVQYDRKRQMLYAEGNVVLSKNSQDKSGEEIFAEALLFNVSTLEGVFDDGKVIQDQSESAKAASTGTTLLVSADIFGRNSSGTIGFKNGVITFCDDPEPHWKIKASRIWLLPGNEFAFLNGVMYIGNIPVFYLPFFYYPKEEVVFNPVFGFRQREGFFMQTTTYVIGRKPVQTDTDENSMFNFTQSDQQMEQKLEGLFLRSTDKRLAETPVNFLKIVGDVYTSLGFLAGAAGSFKPKKVVTNLDFNLYLGFSKTLYQVSGSNVYVPFDPSTGVTTWNKSELFGFSVPFRYSAGFKMGLSTDLLKLSLSMPLYSDPYFESDFFNRKESMDWISYLMSSAGSAPEEINANNLVNSFNWTLNGSITPKIDKLKPYITNFQITSFESGIQFSSKSNQGVSSANDPLRTFYFPQILTPFKINIAFGGTLFSTEKMQTQNNSLQNMPLLTPPDDLVNPNEKARDEKKTSGTELEPIPEVAVEVTAEVAAEVTADVVKNEDGNVDSQNDLFVKELFPDLKITVPSVTALGGTVYSLTYKLTPSFSSQNVYPSDTYKSPSDINWSKFSSTFISVGAAFELGSNLGIRNNFVSMTNTILFEPQYQAHPYISDAYYTTPQKDQIIINDFIAQKANISNTNTVSFRPLALNNIFSDTSVYWNISTKILRTEFTGTVGDPKWDSILPSWNTESITVHSMNLNLAAKQLDGKWKQSLLLSANLPPLAESYTARLQLIFPFVEFSINSGIKKQTPQSTSWNFVPLDQSLTLSFFERKLVLKQNYRYEIDKKYSEAFNVSLTCFGIEAAYTMLYTSTYELDENEGWVVRNEKKFQPNTLSLKYALPNKTFYAWKNRLYFAPSISTGLVVNLIRPTETYFTFDPSITFRINNAIDITFTSKSRNDVVFRYFQDIAGFKYEIPGEKNIFTDLVNSFAFWDKSKRTSSGFKLSALSMKIEHSLHDWTLASELTIQPRLLYDSKSKPYYDISPYFTLSIVWKPLSALKTTIVDDYGTFKLNP